MLARSQNVMPHQPVSGHDLIEPRETPLVRMATVAIFLKDAPDFRRSLNLGCRRFSGDAWSN
jgi:hypothetical protein